MLSDETRIHDLIFGVGTSKRFTQDSPILPEVWDKYFRKAPRPADLLFNPHRRSSPGALRKLLDERLKIEKSSHLDNKRRPWRIPPNRQAHRSLIHNESYVAGRLWLDELVRAALPLTRWWWEYVWSDPHIELLKKRFNLISIEPKPEFVDHLRLAMQNPDNSPYSLDLLWLLKVIGHFCNLSKPETTEEKKRISKGILRSDNEIQFLIRSALQFLEGLSLDKKEFFSDWCFGKKIDHYPLWSVSLNRTATISIWESVPAVKADAAKRVFQMSCSNLRWGIIDSGIDATHSAFQRRSQVLEEIDASAQQEKPQRQVARQPLPERLKYSRVVKTYDFTRLQSLIDPESTSDAFAETSECTTEVRRQMKEMKHRANELKHSLRTGRAIDWDELGPLLRMEHDGNYLAPISDHGTHVAGILGGDWRVDDATMPQSEDNDLIGMCPDIELYDLRVLDQDGNGSEFTVIAALQFLRHLNAHKDQPLIHGVNLSLSIPHKVDSFACGRTPVCEECERLVGSGVVVVAAAGNGGYTGKLGATLGVAPYQNISITDPGNAESVITVGSTHRHMPHTYGVSYFSSRGPTGDGRLKPDLLAPGEKIKSSVPGMQYGQIKTLDGTSMAAPHVSGAAALLMARHLEFIGQPARIKQILCKTATDLGRVRDFQGAGMLDVLRALQSI